MNGRGAAERPPVCRRREVRLWPSCVGRPAHRTSWGKSPPTVPVPSQPETRDDDQEGADDPGDHAGELLAAGGPRLWIPLDQPDAATRTAVVTRPELRTTRRTRNRLRHYLISRQDRILTPTWPTPLLKSSGSPNASTIAPVGPDRAEVKVLIDDERCGGAARDRRCDRALVLFDLAVAVGVVRGPARVSHRIEVGGEVGARRGGRFGGRRVEHDVAGDGRRSGRPFASRQAAGVGNRREIDREFGGRASRRRVVLQAKEPEACRSRRGRWTAGCRCRWRRTCRRRSCQRRAAPRRRRSVRPCRPSAEPDRTGGGEVEAPVASRRCRPCRLSSRRGCRSPPRRSGRPAVRSCARCRRSPTLTQPSFPTARR